jgi:3-hydroxyisobutyrate dehydrogenase
VTATDVVAEQELEAVTAGAHWAGSAAEVAAEVGVVITVLPGAAEVTAVAGPLIAALAPSDVESTCSAEPDTARAGRG